MKDYTLKDIQGFVYESMLVSAAWRAESWRDCEMYDGDKQWTQEDWEAAIGAGIDPLTINRTFPVVNLLLGSEVLNKNDITALGRTQEDTEIANVMTEGIKFVLDQYDGPSIISQCFKDGIIPGCGFASVGHNPDPRKEKIWIQYRDWKDMGWDPFGDPWLNPSQCRYIYYQPWKDLDVLIAMYPEKADELNEAYNQCSEWTHRGLIPTTATQDESTLIEEMKQRIAISSYGRKRVRPCEFWYVTFEEGIWAVFQNGDSIEIEKKGNPREIYQAVMAAEELVKAVVPKIKTVTFLGDTVLHWDYSPYKHDEYPFVPFYGYLDRFNYPMGVPRNIRGQNEEINKRRSMSLALLKNRRVTMEENAVSPDKIQDTYEETQKIGGFIVVKEGKLDKIKIEEQAELYPAQEKMMLQSEREVQEISGANADMLGYKSSQVSGVAIERKQQQGSMITAPLFDNKSRSEKRMGSLIIPEIQSQWRYQKIFRITDRITGTKKYMTLNERLPSGPMGEIQLKNNVTQGKFDIVVSEAPATDTVRERYMEMLIEWVKKSPPEIIPYLMNTAFEISNLPNKEALMARLQPLLGINPEEENMTSEERKQKVIQELQAQQAEAAKMKSAQDTEIGLKLQNLELINQKLAADIEALKSGMKVKSDDQYLKSVQAGFNMKKSVIDSQHQREMDKKAAIGGQQKKVAAIGGRNNG